jgi:hypothetical protein
MHRFSSGSSRVARAAWDRADAGPFFDLPANAAAAWLASEFIRGFLMLFIFERLIRLAAELGQRPMSLVCLDQEDPSRQTVSMRRMPPIRLYVAICDYSF